MGGPHRAVRLGAVTPAASPVRAQIAALAVAAGLIHASALLDHLREYLLFGLFFAVVAPAQIAWGLEVGLRPAPRWLALGAALNAAIALIWLQTRTLGLPFGPDPWQAEGVGTLDVAATLDELAIAALVFITLSGRGRRGGDASRAVVLALLAFSAGALLLGGSHVH